MEAELANNLLTLGARYGEAMRLKEATVGRLCAADGQFFARIRDGRTFTAKKYDEVTAWFSRMWPDGIDWPADIVRPAAGAFVTQDRTSIPNGEAA